MTQHAPRPTQAKGESLSTAPFETTLTLAYGPIHHTIHLTANMGAMEQTRTAESGEVWVTLSITHAGWQQVHYDLAPL